MYVLYLNILMLMVDAVWYYMYMYMYMCRCMYAECLSCEDVPHDRLADRRCSQERSHITPISGSVPAILEGDRLQQYCHTHSLRVFVLVIH